MKYSKNLTLRIATIKEVINPVIKKLIWLNENSPALLNKSKKVAAVIVGTASKNENSTIVFLFNPRIKPPIMVATALETPGIMATIWKTPTKNDCEQDILEISSMLFSFSL